MSKDKKTTVTKTDEKRFDAFKAAMKEASNYTKSVEQVGLASEIYEDVEFITTGSLVLDSILGGGFPVGRLIEIYGENASGKTSIALTAAGALQKKGGNVIFFDCEQAFDPNYAKKLGVDYHKLGVNQGVVAEEVLTQIQILAASGSVDLIIVDSIAALVPAADFNKGLEENTVATKARVLSRAYPKLAKIANENNCTIILLNQTRQNIGVMYGDNTVTTGGKATAYAMSQRIHVKKATKPVEIDGEKVGTTVTFKCVKNKVAPPFGQGETILTFVKGFDVEAETLFVAEKYKILDIQGRTYRIKADKKFDLSPESKATWEDENTLKIATSKADALNELRINKNLMEFLSEKVRVAIRTALMSGDFGGQEE